MNFSPEVLRNEIAVYAELGSGAPKVSDEADYLFFSFINRRGNRASIRLNKADESVEYKNEKCSTRFSSYKALLSSEDFSNLRDWASNQSRLLRDSVDEEKLIPIHGRLQTQTQESQENATIEDIEELLRKELGAGSVNVILLEGPAGIGKTKLLERLALRKAKNFVKTQEPLLLHVRSRGRVLTYLQDLMAYSLQSMRLDATYDQVPILVRHGLIQLAIDGFDELGDPNGYDTAWGQMRELVEDVEGEGTILLAGRETFIGRDRLLGAIPRLRQPGNQVAVFTVQPTSRKEAKQWLLERGLPDDVVKGIDQNRLFEDGSYALRPFFLTQIVDVLKEYDNVEDCPLLIDLTWKMIEREAGKFPDSVRNKKKLRDFVKGILCEIARDMAETEADFIDGDTLTWLVDVVAGENFNSEQIQMLKNRIPVVAFLENDDLSNNFSNRRRFSHTEFYNLFLGYATVDAILEKEIPKYVRRGIFGPDFLISFSDLIHSKLNENESKKFCKSAFQLMERATNFDRAHRNLSALLLSSAPILAQAGITSLPNIDADDAVVRGLAGNIVIKDSIINQLDLRGCDLTNVEFINVIICSLIVDGTTRISRSFPNVSWIQLVDKGRERTLRGSDASEWLDDNGRNIGQPSDGEELLQAVRARPTYQLLQKICRVMLRQHWIRSDGDDHVSKLIQSEYWINLRDILLDNELLDEEKRQASGPRSVFYHIRKAREILDEDLSDGQGPFLPLIKAIEHEQTD